MDPDSFIWISELFFSQGLTPASLAMGGRSMMRRALFEPFGKAQDRLRELARPPVLWAQLIE